MVPRDPTAHGFVISQNMRADDPTAAVKPTRAIKSLGHKTWKHPEIVMYRVRYKVGTTARFALELMLNMPDAPRPLAARHREAKTVVASAEACAAAASC